VIYSETSIVTRLIRLIPLVSLVLALSACNGNGLQEALKPDPRLTTSPEANPQGSPQASPEANLPSNPTPSPAASPAASPIASPTAPSDSTTYSDLDKTPKELRPYLDNLLQLGLLPLTCKESPCKEFKPNQAITRREYARWLIAVNNRFHASKPAKLIRLATDANEPAFSDLPKTDPDFAFIQGLAETGLISSRLSGDTSLTQFRPDASLTREEMILWKVPIDTRQTLPTATIEAIQKTWGFQDSEKISPNALRALLIDHQNGDQANTRRAFGYTTLFQPKRPATRAEAAAVLWSFGFQADLLNAQDSLKEASTQR
jgi:hypothetical protein